MLGFRLLQARDRKHAVPTLVCAHNGIPIARTLDPEQRTHFVSFARILTSLDIPICGYLVDHKMELGIHYFCDLGVVGPPFLDLWIPVSVARTRLLELGVLIPVVLKELMGPQLDRIWSLHDLTQSTLVHNWRLDSLPLMRYSTDRLCRRSFSVSQISKLDGGEVIQTGLEPNHSTKVGEGVGQVAFWKQDEVDLAMLRMLVDTAERKIHSVISGRKGEEEEDTSPGFLDVAQVRAARFRIVSLIERYTAPKIDNMRVSPRVTLEKVRDEEYEALLVDALHSVERHFSSLEYPRDRNELNRKNVVVGASVQTDFKEHSDRFTQTEQYKEADTEKLKALQDMLDLQEQKLTKLHRDLEYVRLTRLLLIGCMITIIYAFLYPLYFQIRNSVYHFHLLAVV